jgi:hypothetical protein
MTIRKANACRGGIPYFGVSVRVWVVAASTAALEKGRGKVVP